MCIVIVRSLRNPYLSCMADPAFSRIAIHDIKKHATAHHSPLPTTHLFNTVVFLVGLHMHSLQHGTVVPLAYFL